MCAGSPQTILVAFKLTCLICEGNSEASSSDIIIMGVEPEPHSITGGIHWAIRKTGTIIISLYYIFIHVLSITNQ